MTFTVIVPAACVLPGIEPDPRAGATFPGLARLADRATISEVDGGVAAALCSTLGIARQEDWPLAPFAARGDGLAAESGHWQFADPVHTALSHADVTLASILSEIPDQDAAEMHADLNRLFAPDGLEFVAGRRSRQWYLHSRQAVRLRTIAPRAALGTSMRASLPAGEDAATWRRWTSEIQMLLHDHPVNRRREARGDARIDALWLWGGGILPVNVERSPVVAFVDDPVLRCIVAGAGGDVAGGVEVASPTAVRQADRPVLAWLDALERATDAHDASGWRKALGRIDAQWFVPLADTAADGRSSIIVLGGRARARRLELRRRSARERFAFWRRRRDDAGLLDDPSEPV